MSVAASANAWDQYKVKAFSESRFLCEFLERNPETRGRHLFELKLRGELARTRRVEPE